MAKNPEIDKSIDKAAKPQAPTLELPKLNPKLQNFLNSQYAKILITFILMLALFGTTVLIVYLTEKIKGSTP
jgi:hypothetical protein